jgi:hypothetical protein
MEEGGFGGSAVGSAGCSQELVELVCTYHIKMFIAGVADAVAATAVRAWSIRSISGARRETSIVSVAVAVAVVSVNVGSL